MSTTTSADPAISRFLGFKFKEGTTDEQKANAVKGLFKLYEDLARYVNQGPVGALLKYYANSVAFITSAGGKSLVQGPNRRFDYMFTVEFKVRPNDLWDVLSLTMITECSGERRILRKS